MKLRARGDYTLFLRKTGNKSISIQQEQMNYLHVYCMNLDLVNS